MSEIINDYSYFLLIIILCLTIVIYGRPKKHDNLKIEYEETNYKYLKILTIFEKQLQKYNSTNFDFIKITDKINLSECFIPNIVDIFFINIKPHSHFYINNHVSNDIAKLMILYDHNSNLDDYDKNLMLLINYKKECIDEKCSYYGYYYDINKKISILDIYPIYNNSNSVVNLTIFIIKKSYWHF